MGFTLCYRLKFNNPYGIKVSQAFAIIFKNSFEENQGSVQKNWSSFQCILLALIILISFIPPIPQHPFIETHIPSSNFNTNNPSTTCNKFLDDQILKDLGVFLSHNRSWKKILTETIHSGTWKFIRDRYYPPKISICWLLQWLRLLLLCYINKSCTKSLISPPDCCPPTSMKINLLAI